MRTFPPPTSSSNMRDFLLCASSAESRCGACPSINNGREYTICRVLLLHGHSTTHCSSQVDIIQRLIHRMEGRGGIAHAPKCPLSPRFEKSGEIGNRGEIGNKEINGKFKYIACCLNHWKGTFIRIFLISCSSSGLGSNFFYIRNLDLITILNC